MRQIVSERRMETMTDWESRKLSRAGLLEMLVEQVE